MKIFVKAKTGAREEKVQKIDGINYKVFVKEHAEKGKANAAIIRVLADFLKVPMSSISIVSGTSSKQKILEINFSAS